MRNVVVYAGARSFAGDAVAITVEMRCIARLPNTNRRSARGTRIGTSRVVDCRRFFRFNGR